MDKQKIGTVISANMKNTIVVKVERKFRHPLYQKVITKHKKFKVHNEIAGIAVGDQVVIESSRPISKEKHFVVIRKVESKTK